MLEVTGAQCFQRCVWLRCFGQPTHEMMESHVKMCLIQAFESCVAVGDMCFEALCFVTVFASHVFGDKN